MRGAPHGWRLARIRQGRPNHLAATRITDRAHRIADRARPESWIECDQNDGDGQERMTETSGILFLRSGRWRWRVEAVPGSSEELLELCEPGNATNKMQVALPFSWRQLEPDAFREIARRPDVRLWLDEAGILWRVTAVGPNTPYAFPLERRHLVYDSQQSWAGIVEFPDTEQLGDLTNRGLRELRNRAADFGGRRRAYRRPAG